MRISEATAGITADRLIRVMIVDDHRVVRSGIRFSLLAFHDLELVAEAENGKEALAVCRQMRDSGGMPDVILMDLLMSEMDGVATTRAILDRHPEAQVIDLGAGCLVGGSHRLPAQGCDHRRIGRGHPRCTRRPGDTDPRRRHRH